MSPQHDEKPKGERNDQNESTELRQKKTTSRRAEPPAPARFFEALPEKQRGDRPEKEHGDVGADHVRVADEPRHEEQRQSRENARPEAPPLAEESAKDRRQRRELKRRRQSPRR